MAQEEVYLFYCTVSDVQEGRRVASELVNQGLIACANIYGPITSVFPWNGEVQTESEHVVMGKTTARRFADLEAAVCRIHSYECPCIVGWPLQQGHEPFLQWVAETVQNGEAEA